MGDWDGAAIEVEDLTVAYTGSPVLWDLDLQKLFIPPLGTLVSSNFLGFYIVK